MAPYTNALAEATVVTFEQARAASKTTIDAQSRARQLRDAAVAFSKRGFRVFPVRSNGKKPAIEDWPEQASDNPVRVRRFLPLSVDLRNPNDVKGLARTIRAAEERFGQKCVLTIIDTVSRVLAGGDENSSTDMGGLIKNFDKIREAIGCHLMAIHHTGKDDSRGARGWSGLKAALDTELEVKDGAVTVKKQRDLEFAEPVVFHLEGAEIGRGPEGEAVTSAVVRIGEKPKPVEATEEFEHALTEREEQMLRAFDRAVLKKYGQKYNRGAKEFFLTGPEWDAEMTESLPVIGFNDGLSRQTLDGFRRELTAKGVLKKIKRNQWIRGD